MVAKKDERTETLGSNFRENTAAFLKELKLKREARLWKTGGFPNSLCDAIYGLTKDEMDKIRKNYEFKNLSALNKQDLAKTLARLIPISFKQMLKRLDQNQYDLFKMIINHSGALSDMGMKADNLEALRDFSLVFPVIDNGQKFLSIPDELSAVVSQSDGPELKRIVKRNTQWICLAHGMLHYYGVMGVRPLMEKIEKLTDQKIDMLEFMQVMSFACDFYGQLWFTGIGFSDRKILKPEQILQEQKMRADLDYYPFTRKQLMDASDPDFTEKTTELDRFIRFIRDCYEISAADLNKIIVETTRMIKDGTKMVQILEYLQTRLEFPSFEFAQELTEIISAVHNSTRQWVLKGYTPDELFQEERKHLRPLPKTPFKSPPEASIIKNAPIASNPIISNPPVKNKVGRNEPCPCGSGKKFKKCCGK